MKPKYYFGTYSLNSNIILTFVKSPTHGKYKLFISQKNISLTKFYENYVYYFHNQTIKSMNITYGKTTHFVRLTKPKQAYQQSLDKLINKAQLGQASPYTNLNNWRTRELVSQISTTIEQLEPLSIKS